MDARDALALLAPDGQPLHPIGAWLDLGCGDGTFTVALAELLQAGSTIEAVDRDERALRRIPSVHAGIPIRTTHCDFASLPLAGHGLAGVLMANALHFVADQSSFLSALAKALKTGGTLLIVEYDTEEARAPWVPYPVSARELAHLASAAGFAPPITLGRRRSQFGESCTRRF